MGNDYGLFRPNDAIVIITIHPTASDEFQSPVTIFLIGTLLNVIRTTLNWWTFIWTSLPKISNLVIQSSDIWVCNVHAKSHLSNVQGLRKGVFRNDPVDLGWISGYMHEWIMPSGGSVRHVICPRISMGRLLNKWWMEMIDTVIDYYVYHSHPSLFQ